MLPLRHALGIFLGLVSLGAVPGAWAQQYPARTIRLIVPVTPGGGVDFMARLVGTRLSDTLGHQVVVDNRPGAGNVLGSAIAAKAAPDGHTLLLANNSSHGVAQARSDRIPYDTVKDFSPIAVIAEASFMLATRPDVPVASIQELVSNSKAKGTPLNYGAAGSGTQTYLMGELLKLGTGISMTNVAYQSAGPATTALLSGEVQLSFLTTSGGLPHVTSGRLKAIGITGVKRSSVLPLVATLSEQKVPGFETGAWYALVGPARIPVPVVQRLNKEIAAMVRDPGIQEKLQRQGTEPVGGTIEECAATIKNELAKWTMVVKKTGIRFE